jgi:hypothetical protein
MTARTVNLPRFPAETRAWETKGLLENDASPPILVNANRAEHGLDHKEVFNASRVDIL